jgi:biotin carboxyl carrier protein
MDPVVGAGEEVEVAFHPGESLAILDRVVVAPTVGRFRPVSTVPLTVGSTVLDGQTIGFVDDFCGSTPIRSPFGGSLMGMLAVPGELVQAGQPIAWLRVGQ